MTNAAQPGSSPGEMPHRDRELRVAGGRSPGRHESTSGAGGGCEDLVQAITFLRGRIDEEFRISERLDSKSRQAFALAAGFFAVVQTVTFGSFAQSSITSAERVVLLVAALLAGLAVAAVAHKLTHGEELQDERDVKPDSVVGWVEEADPDDAEHVLVRLLSGLREVAESRTENNKIRERNYKTVATATQVALIMAGVELITALTVRL